MYKTVYLQGGRHGHHDVCEGKAIYANASKSKRMRKKAVKEEQISIGRVIDLKKHIFQNRFKDDNISQEKLLLALRNQKAEAYPSEVLPLETKRIATLSYKKMKITCPETIKTAKKK